MHAFNEKPVRRRDGRSIGRKLKAEIEADVLELWIGVSRLLARLREPRVPHDTRRRHTARGRRVIRAARR